MIASFNNDLLRVCIACGHVAPVDELIAGSGHKQVAIRIGDCDRFDADQLLNIVFGPLQVLVIVVSLHGADVGGELASGINRRIEQHATRSVALGKPMSIKSTQ